MLDFDLFTRVVDEAGPSLGRIDFFNYGEAFLHKRAVEMCEYIKSTFPHIYLYTSTNGLAFTEEQVTPPGPLRHRRGHLLDRRRDAGELRQIPAARRLRQGDRQPALRRRREARARARRAVHQLALHPVHAQRQRRGDGRGARAGGGDRRRSPVLGADRSSRGPVLAPLRAGHAGPRRDPPRDLGRQQPRQRHPRRDAARRDSASAARCPACR